jgi:HK97 family phage prohead protease
MQKNADGREFRVLTPFQVIKSEAVFGRKGATIIDSGGTGSTDAQDNPRVLRCSGYANWCGENSTYVDLVGDVVVPSGVELSVWQDNPQILWQHDPWLSVGQGVKLEKRSDGVYVEFDVHLDTLSPEDVYRVENGLVKFLSIGFRVLDGEFREIGTPMAEGPCGYQEAFFITRSLLLEISLVTIPANSASGFSIVKQIDSETKAFGGSFTRKDLDDSGATPTDTKPETDMEDTLSKTLKLKYSEFKDADTLEDLKAKGVDVEQETEVKIVDLIQQVSGEVSAAAVKEISIAVAEIKAQIEELSKSIEARGATEGDDADAEGDDADAEGDDADAEGDDADAEGEGDDTKDLDVSVEEIEELRNTLRDLSKALADI